MDSARIPREATRDLSALYSIFGLDLLSFVRRVRGKICMLSINRLKVNNSTQLNFTSPTGKRIAWMFRLGEICNCWLLSCPADGLVLLLADVLNHVHLDSKWGRSSLCPAFMCGLSSVLYRLLVPARHTQKWSKVWRRPKYWRLPEISLISVRPQQSLSLLIGVLSKSG